MTSVLRFWNAEGICRVRLGMKRNHLQEMLEETFVEIVEWIGEIGIEALFDGL